jgi:hypothetical protein
MIHHFQQLIYHIKRLNNPVTSTSLSDLTQITWSLSINNLVTERSRSDLPQITRSLSINNVVTERSRSDPAGTDLKSAPARSVCA